MFDLATSTRNALHVALDDNDTIKGVAYFSRQVALAADSPAAIEAFAQIGVTHRGEKMIVGPRYEVAMYWDLVREKHDRPRLIRDRQFVMMLDRSMLLPYHHSVVARRARIDEWPAVADNSASMIAAELDYDPMRSSPEFTSNVRAMIDRGLWWVASRWPPVLFLQRRPVESAHGAVARHLGATRTARQGPRDLRARCGLRSHARSLADAFALRQRLQRSSDCALRTHRLQNCLRIPNHIVLGISFSEITDRDEKTCRRRSERRIPRRVRRR